MAKDTLNPTGDREQSSLPERVTLRVVLQAVLDAVKRAQVEVQAGAEKKLDWFFPQNRTTGQREARTVSIPLPDAQGNYHTREIPLFALVPHHDLMIDSLTLRMKLSLEDVQRLRGEEDEIAAQLPTPGLDKDFVAELEVRFKGTEAVEGVARLNDQLVKRI
jgi:hypothetical protein